MVGGNQQYPGKTHDQNLGMISKHIEPERKFSWDQSAHAISIEFSRIILDTKYSYQRE